MQEGDFQIGWTEGLGGGLLKEKSLEVGEEEIAKERRKEWGIEKEKIEL